MITKTAYIGKPISRVDGLKKVTGLATYAGEFKLDKLAHGYVVNSTIAKGKITWINTEDAKNVKGVLSVFTHENLPPLVKGNAEYGDPLAPPGQPFRPLFNENILFNGQPIALVVAETFELAQYAAGLIKVIYKEDPFEVELEKNIVHATRKDVKDPPKNRGDAEKSYASAEIKVSCEYKQPRNYHNPMEPHTSIAIWNDLEKSFTIYDKIQGVGSSQEYICGIFNLEKEKVRILSPFVGGAFGSGLRPQYQLFLSALASKTLNRPVKVALTRRQMFSFGHRPACLQRLMLSTDSNGKLTSIQHQAYGETSKFENFSENVVGWAGLMYQCDNVKLDYQLVPLNVYTPMDMRAPGGTTGMYGLECAIDEMAIEANMDPLEFRILNFAQTDQNENKPFSSKELKACYRQSANRFGWDQRKADPRSTKKDHKWVGYGMATGVWEAMQQKSAAKAVLSYDGHLTISSGTADIGTGTYTIMSQIAAETLGVPLHNVTFNLGDTSLPKAPIEGGSWTASSVGSAVKMVCMEMRRKLFDLAREFYSEKLKENAEESISIANGRISFNSDFTISCPELFQKANKDQIESLISNEPEEERKKYSCYTHSCVMVEVNVDEDLGMITVPKVVCAVAGGRIINPKTAESQILGGITWGISMALEEEGMIDVNNGRIMNSNLAEYHVAVNADIQEIDVIFVEENDNIVNPLGAKGLGEIGIVGVAAAISNAVFNATGKRVRELPITLDKVL